MVAAIPGTSTLPVVAIVVSVVLVGILALANFHRRQPIAAGATGTAAAPSGTERSLPIVERAPFPLMVHAEGGEVLHVNAAWTELSGYTHGDIPTVGDWLKRAYGHRATDTLKFIFARKYALQSRWEEGSFTISTRSGQQRVWKFSTAPLGQLPDGRQVVVSMAADVTQLYQEATLPATEDASRSRAPDRTTVGLINATLAGRIFNCNSHACQLLGYSQEELLTKSLQDILQAEDLPVFLADRQQLLAGTRTSFHQELRYLRQDGSAIWASTGVSSIQDDAGNPKYLSAVLQDITASRQALEGLEQSQQLLETILNALPLRIFWKDRDSVFLGCDQSCAKAAGLPNPAAIVGKTDYDLCWTEPQATAYRADDRQVMDSGQAKLGIIETQVRADGEQVWIETHKAPLQDESGQVVGVLGAFQDITARMQAEAALRASEERYRLLAESTSDLICLHEPNDGRYLFVSQSCQALLGYHYSEMVGRDPQEFIHLEDRDRLHHYLCDLTPVGAPGPITYRMQTESGAYIWFETLAKPIHNEGGQVVRLQTTSRDATERVKTQARLVYEARHDTLTDLPNRTLLTERLVYCLQQLQRHPQRQFALLFLDLDRFKVINDSLGHGCGDRVLTIVAGKLRALTRNIDLAARLGGDEFVVLLADVSEVKDAVVVAERISCELQAPIEIEGRDMVVGVSIGIVMGTDRYDRPDSVLRDADLAMYRAKLQRGTPHKIAIFNTDMHARALQRLNLESDLRQALRRDELRLSYQPIVALPIGRPVALEALLRWQHPTRGPISPAEFIPIAEETGIIVSLDRWVMQTACRHLAAWRERLPQMATFKIGINLSARDLQAPDLLETIDRLLATGLTGRCITLEITESMLVENPAEIVPLLERLRARHLHLSIDDFGTGYSSLAYLHQLPVDSLKIDRSFVSQMLRDRRSYEIVETLIALSNRLGIEAVAEGVETQQQCDLLTQLGCEFGQGYYFARPIAAPDVEAFLLQSLQG